MSLQKPRPALPCCIAFLLTAATACSGTTPSSGSTSTTDGGGTDGSTDAGGGPTDAGPMATACASAESAADGGIDVVSNLDDAGPPTPGYPATFPTPPQVVNYGGPVLSSPKWVPIFFSNDDPTEVCTLTTFFRQTATSLFWQPVSEYGVGPVQSVTPVLLDEPAPATIDDTDADSPLVMWLQGEISAGKVPMPDSNTVYAINYPKGTTVTQDGDSSCIDFGGYHSDMQLSNGTDVAYSVVTRCPTDQYFTDIEYFTQSESHELIEAATDPYPDFNAAWVQVDNNFLEWDGANGGSEIADMCEDDAQSYWIFPDSPFEVQRYWSNAMATAGHEPCVPWMPNEVYFNAMPVMTDMISYDDPEAGQTQTLPGVNVTATTPATITVDLYSDGPTTGPWTVSAYDYNEYFLGTASDLAFSFNQTTGENGATVQLTISLTSTAAGTGNTDPFFVLSTQGTGENAITHYSMGIVNE